MVILVCRRVPFAPSVWASLLERVIDGAASELLFREAEMVSVGTKYETFLAAGGGVGNYLALLYPPFCAAKGTQCAVCRQSAAEFFFKWVDARLINRFKGGCKLPSTNTSRGAECVSHHQPIFTLFIIHWRQGSVGVRSVIFTALIAFL